MKYIQILLKFYAIFQDLLPRVNKKVIMPRNRGIFRETPLWGLECYPTPRMGRHPLERESVWRVLPRRRTTPRNQYAQCTAALACIVATTTPLHFHSPPPCLAPFPTAQKKIVK